MKIENGKQEQTKNESGKQ